jgi:hypothetical protein
MKPAQRGRAIIRTDKFREATMTLSRRNVAFAGALALGTSGLLGNPSAAIAQSGEEAAVNQAIEALRKAMVDADKARLEELVADQLSYGHSSGVIESKAQFVSVVAGKKTIYKSIACWSPLPRSPAPTRSRATSSRPKPKPMASRARPASACCRSGISRMEAGSF